MKNEMTFLSFQQFIFDISFSKSVRKNCKTKIKDFGSTSQFKLILNYSRCIFKSEIQRE